MGVPPYAEESRARRWTVRYVLLAPVLPPFRRHLLKKSCPPCFLLHVPVLRWVSRPSFVAASIASPPTPTPPCQRVVGITVQAEVSSTRCETLPALLAACQSCVHILPARSVWLASTRHFGMARVLIAPHDPQRSCLRRAVGRGAVPSHTLDSWLPSFCPHNNPTPSPQHLATLSMSRSTRLLYASYVVARCISPLP